MSVPLDLAVLRTLPRNEELPETILALASLEPTLRRGLIGEGAGPIREAMLDGVAPLGIATIGCIQAIAW